MRMAIVGCGFVADYYVATLGLHSNLEIAGVFDRDGQRAEQFASHHSLRRFATMDELLDDPSVEMVLNLTNPRSHYDVSLRALAAGKHVYSEKPLAMELDQAKELVTLADERGLRIASAPCSLLGETAQTVWKALRDNEIGTVRLVYAEMDEGMVYKMPFRRWASASGTPWPYRDEFEVGTTLEHAGYVLAWLPAFFGPIESIRTFSANVVADKGIEPPLEVNPPDFTLGCIRFRSGLIARLTCSLLAPHDHSLRIVGDDGVLLVDDTWFYTAPVKVRQWLDIKGRHLALPKRTIPLAAKGQKYNYRGTQQMDFARGPADMAESIVAKRPARLSAEYSLHINEAVLALHYGLGDTSPYAMTTTIAPVEPMAWAQAAPRRSIRVRATSMVEKVARRLSL